MVTIHVVVAKGLCLGLKTPEKVLQNIENILKNCGMLEYNGTCIEDKHTIIQTSCALYPICSESIESSVGPLAVR